MGLARRIGGAMIALFGAVIAARYALAAAPVAPSLLHPVYHGQIYTTCEIDPSTQDLRLFWADGHGAPLRDFSAVARQVEAGGGRLLFAANAGIFGPDLKPVGLLVLNGNETVPLNLADGAGNFYAKPNGVFVINLRRHAQVVESGSYPALVPPALWATQSGPLLVYGGNLNPDFIETSRNRKIRSGVGVTATGRVVFALSQRPVTFYEFASLFLNRLKCPNALFLDGTISDFYVPGSPATPTPHTFGPMFGVVAPAP